MTKKQLTREILRIFRLRVAEERYKVERRIKEEATLNFESFEQNSTPVCLAEQYIQFIG